MTTDLLIQELYKPYKITKKGNITIIYSMDGNFVIKKKKTDINKLYKYLYSKGFKNVPSIVDNSRKDIIIYEYLEEVETPIEQKYKDMILLVTKLHKKTSFNKEINNEKIKELYIQLKNNIEFYKNKYETMLNECNKEEFMSPSNQIFAYKYSKLNNRLNFCKSELDKWYELIKNNATYRVSVVHGNLDISHYINNEKEVLISFDNYSYDTPILDIYYLFKKEEILKYPDILDNYINNMDLQDYEKKLLFILLAMPNNIDFTTNEYESCNIIQKEIDYTDYIDLVLKPYYSINYEEE